MVHDMPLQQVTRIAIDTPLMSRLWRDGVPSAWCRPEQLQTDDRTRLHNLDRSRRTSKADLFLDRNRSTPPTLWNDAAQSWTFRWKLSSRVSPFRFLVLAPWPGQLSSCDYVIYRLSLPSIDQCAKQFALWAVTAQKKYSVRDTSSIVRTARSKTWIDRYSLSGSTFMISRCALSNSADFFSFQFNCRYFSVKMNLLQISASDHASINLPKSHVMTSLTWYKESSRQSVYV